jgi:hypothetical protein
MGFMEIILNQGLDTKTMFNDTFRKNVFLPFLSCFRFPLDVAPCAFFLISSEQRM